MATEDIRNIKVPNRFKHSDPRRRKIKVKLDAINSGLSPVVYIDRDKYIMDGYTSYLAYKQLGFKRIPVQLVETEDTISASALAFAKIIVFCRDKYTCYICGRTLEEKELTLDHVVPRCKGGDPIDLENLKCCCRICNNLKGSFTYSPELVSVIKTELKERGIL